LLESASWECCGVAPGEVEDPKALEALELPWLCATVPGTVVGALRTAGRWSWLDDDQDLLDGQDWWFRAAVDPYEGYGPWYLDVGGLATIADVWVDGEHVLHSENMFLRHRVEVRGDSAPRQIVIRCAALAPVLARRRPRPRWRSQLVRSQNLRWIRTTPLGRIDGWSFSAAPVGPWRPVRLYPSTPDLGIVDGRLEARCVGEGGEVTVEMTLAAGLAPGPLSIGVGDVSVPLEVRPHGKRYVARGTVRLSEVERWWPHTHGSQPLYPVVLYGEDQEIPVATVGFRTVEVDRTGEGFRLIVNGVAIFCRGACWVPPDATGLSATRAELRTSLGLMREVGMNMVRVGGYTTYEDDAFWEICDELGLMVWQDCMLASVEPPEDEPFLADLTAELVQVFTALQGHPALALVSGSSEVHQQAAMFGIALDQITSTALDVTIPGLAERLLPGVPYVPSSPSGGDLPFDPSKGIAHYFGVGAYLRPPEDAQLAGVRFAAECLAFATPPEPATVERFFGGAQMAGHHPTWKRGVARDSNTSWDFEDVRDHYVRRLFGVDPVKIRYEDPGRALDLGRAVVAELMSTVLRGWRCRASGCSGALVLDWQDLYPGAGWGILDVSGEPKAPWYAIRRVMAPVGVVLTDGGLSGLGVHVFNDDPEPLIGEVTLTLFTPFGAAAERVSCPVELPGRSELDTSAERVLKGFRDLTYAYRFGPPAFDVVLVELATPDGTLLGSDVFLPAGPGRPVVADLGLRAVARHDDQQRWSLTVSAEGFAQWVRVDVPGFRAADSWFHLPPGGSKTLALTPTGPSVGPQRSGSPGPGSEQRRPFGQVQALNLASSVAVSVES
jgi:beta-mannosidase